MLILIGPVHGSKLLISIPQNYLLLKGDNLSFDAFFLRPCLPCTVKSSRTHWCLALLFAMNIETGKDGYILICSMVKEIQVVMV